jgi:molybdopterin-guanine dinucleotide biosynthesis protein A
VYHRPMRHNRTEACGDVTAFILAGGKSTRMGTEKAFVELDGRNLLFRALDLTRAITPNVRIVGSRGKFSNHGSVIEDVFRDCGPLGGIHAALRVSETELNLALAVDMPLVSPSFLRYLIGQAAAATELAIVPRCDGRLQPLCAIYRREFGDAAERALRKGRNKIELVFDEVSIRVIEGDEMARAGFSCDMFRNLNTPEELRASKKSTR